MQVEKSTSASRRCQPVVSSFHRQRNSSSSFVLLSKSCLYFSSLCRAASKAPLYEAIWVVRVEFEGEVVVKKIVSPEDIEDIGKGDADARERDRNRGGGLRRKFDDEDWDWVSNSQLPSDVANDDVEALDDGG